MQTLITSWILAFFTTTTNPPVVRLIQFHVKPAYQQSFQNALTRYVARALKTPGNIMAEAYYEETNRATLWLVERWHHKYWVKSKTLTTLMKTTMAAPADTFLLQDLEPLPKTAYRTPAAPKDRPLTIMLFVDAKPGTEDEFKKIYHQAMPAFRSEPGVITYQLSQSTGEKTKFVTYEKFSSQAAFDYHLRFPPIEPVLQYLRSAIIEQPFEKGLHRLIQFAP